MVRGYVPDRGDVVWITMNPQAGRRPAVVLSPASCNEKTPSRRLKCISLMHAGWMYNLNIVFLNSLTGLFPPAIPIERW
jgi:hypothetical protein